MSRPFSPSKLSAFLYQKRILRLYGTQNILGTSSSGASRKSVTILNDNGLASWNTLSTKGKIFRTTQQTFNATLIIIGAVLSGGVAYLLYNEVFSPDSKVNNFNRAFDRVKKDSRCIAILGDPDNISAYGMPITNSRRKTSHLVSKIETDQNGIKNFYMTFNVEGTKNKGVVYVHMVKKPHDNEFTYNYLTLEVNGSPRIYLEKPIKERVNSSSNFKLFGVSWR